MPCARPCAVADAKYKAEKRNGYPDADLYQMLAYCTALGLPRGHLVHAGGGAPRGAHRVRGAGVVLHRHALDLDQPPERLLAAVRELAARLAQDAAAVAQGTGSPGASAPSVSPW